MLSNNEFSSVTSKNSEEYKKHNANSLNSNHNVAEGAVTHQAYRQGIVNKLYAEKFGDAFKNKSNFKNSESLNCKNVEKENIKNSFCNPRYTDNRNLNVFAQNVSTIDSRRNLQIRQDFDSHTHYNCGNKNTLALSSQVIKSSTADTTAQCNESYKTVDASDSNEYQSDSDEDYEVFKAGPHKEADNVEIPSSTTQDALQEVEKNISKTNLNNLLLKTLKNCSVKNYVDFQLLMRKLKYEFTLSVETLSVLYNECLITGATESEIFTYLRNKDTFGTVDELKKSISEFFVIAAQNGILKLRNKRYYLSFVDDMIIHNAYQFLKRKTEIISSDFEKNIPVADSYVIPKRNADLKEEKKSMFATDFGTSTSKDNKRLSDNESEKNVQRKTENDNQIGGNYILNNIRQINVDFQNMFENVQKKAKEEKAKSNTAENIEEDLRKTTVLCMINAARYRRENNKKG